ncbi:MAG: hypothetical protein VW397_02800, partial [Candidatus Margulisiibacteriota bacterium]
MKQFLFDCIVDKKNICGMTEEVRSIEQIIDKGRNVVIYGPRNYGKTSLVKSVVIPNFKKKNKKTLTVCIDFMGVLTLEDIFKKIINGFEFAF